MAQRRRNCGFPFQNLRGISFSGSSPLTTDAAATWRDRPMRAVFLLHVLALRVSISGLAAS
jgi:hypothetical protein